VGDVLLVEIFHAIQDLSNVLASFNLRQSNLSIIRIKLTTIGDDVFVHVLAGGILHYQIQLLLGFDDLIGQC